MDVAPGVDPPHGLTRPPLERRPPPRRKASALPLHQTPKAVQTAKSRSWMESRLGTSKSLSSRRFLNGHSRSKLEKNDPAMNKIIGSVQAAGRVPLGEKWSACVGARWKILGRRAAVRLERVPTTAGTRRAGWRARERRQTGRRRHRLERRSTRHPHGAAEGQTTQKWGMLYGILCFFASQTDRCTSPRRPIHGLLVYWPIQIHRGGYVTCKIIGRYL